MSELASWLLAQIEADEEAARESGGLSWQVTYDGEAIEDSDGEQVAPVVWGAFAPHIARHDPARVLADCEALRAVIKWHENWPVLVETQPTIEPVDSADPQSFAFRASQQIAWMTEREYVARFGTEPPTSPILRALASVYEGAPGWQEEWR